MWWPRPRWKNDFFAHLFLSLFVTITIPTNAVMADEEQHCNGSNMSAVVWTTALCTMLLVLVVIAIYFVYCKRKEHDWSSLWWKSSSDKNLVLQTSPPEKGRQQKIGGTDNPAFSADANVGDCVTGTGLTRIVRVAPSAIDGGSLGIELSAGKEEDGKNVYTCKHSDGSKGRLVALRLIVDKCHQQQQPDSSDLSRALVELSRKYGLHVELETEGETTTRASVASENGDETGKCAKSNLLSAVRGKAQRLWNQRQFVFKGGDNNGGHVEANKDNVTAGDVESGLGTATVDVTTTVPAQKSSCTVTMVDETAAAGQQDARKCNGSVQYRTLEYGASPADMAAHSSPESSVQCCTVNPSEPVVSVISVNAVTSAAVAEVEHVNAVASDKDAMASDKDAMASDKDVKAADKDAAATADDVKKPSSSVNDEPPKQVAANPPPPPPRKYSVPVVPVIPRASTISAGAGAAAAATAAKTTSEPDVKDSITVANTIATTAVTTSVNTSIVPDTTVTVTATTNTGAADTVTVSDTSTSPTALDAATPVPVTYSGSDKSCTPITNNEIRIDDDYYWCTTTSMAPPSMSTFGKRQSSVNGVGGDDGVVNGGIATGGVANGCVTIGSVFNGETAAKKTMNALVNESDVVVVEEDDVDGDNDEEGDREFVAGGGTTASIEDASLPSFSSDEDEDDDDNNSVFTSKTKPSNGVVNAGENGKDYDDIGRKTNVRQLGRKNDDDADGKDQGDRVRTVAAKVNHNGESRNNNAMDAEQKSPTKLPTLRLSLSSPLSNANPITNTNTTSSTTNSSYFSSSASSTSSSSLSSSPTNTNGSPIVSKIPVRRQSAGSTAAVIATAVSPPLTNGTARKSIPLPLSRSGSRLAMWSSAN